MKTSELTGAALDWAVAMAENWAGADFEVKPYSTDWAQGGPIIERERIAIGFDGFDIFDSALPIWGACKYDGGVEGYGPTPLTAAMRCFAASKLGDTVEIPDELVEG
jgi:hypothetical protein